MFFIQQKLLLQILWGQVSWQCSTLKVKFKRSPSHENQNCHNWQSWHPLIKLLFVKATLNQISCTSNWRFLRTFIMWQLHRIVYGVLCSVHPKEDKYFRISKHCSTTLLTGESPASSESVVTFWGVGLGRAFPFKYGTCLFSSANILIFGCRHMVLVKTPGAERRPALRARNF